MGADPQDLIFDVAVVGAGPAGSATARRLAQRGWRVALLERTRFELPRVGESLAPDVQEPLRELGVWPEFMALAPLPSWGTVSLWGEAVQQSYSHLISPYGCGWHVDRRAFDHMLAGSAAAAGAHLFEGTALQRSVYRDGGWRLDTTCSSAEAPAQAQTLRSRVLIDATGRRAQVARSQGAQRFVFDRLVGVAMRWAGVNAVEESHLLVEAGLEGWWYSAPLPGAASTGNAAMILMLMTDADLCAQLRLTGAERWQAILQSTRASRLRVGGAQAVSRPLVHCAHSQRMRREGAQPGGPWLTVGDAALAVDPVSGSGVLRALRTAQAAADTTHTLLTRPEAADAALADYEIARDAECSAYLIERAQYYAAEQRFDTPFWQRRQVLRQRAPAVPDRTAAVAL